MLSGDRYHRRRTEAVTEHSKKSHRRPWKERLPSQGAAVAWEWGQEQQHVFFEIRDGVTLKNLTFTPRGQSVYLVNHGRVHDDPCSELPTLRNIQHQTKNIIKDKRGKFTMTSTNIIHVDSNNFQQEVENSSVPCACWFLGTMVRSPAVL